MPEEKRNPRPLRRVVTGHDSNKTAKVLIDAAASNRKIQPSGTVSTLVWCTDATPADIPIGEEAEDMGARILGTAPPPGGTRFTVNDFPPGNTAVMHRTETVDYVLVLSGEIDMVMDESTVKLKAGDVMVQRGTNHAWVNRGTEVARVAFVLIDARPLGIGKAVSGTSSPGGH
jgi:quercetin dioxygenase-like cupin family protein